MEVFESWGANTVATIASDRILTIVVNGDYFTISSENERFATAKEALKAKNMDVLLQALKPIELVKNVIKMVGNDVRVEDDAVFYKDSPVHGLIVTRILEFARQGYDYKPLAMFLENIMQNPSKTVVDEFYEWLERADTPMPITEDGHFLAYKKVKANFKDIYSGKLDYSVGNIVEEPRNTVDDDRNRTCSNGLHFCSLGYLPNFGMGSGPVVVIVKINPRDVVAFPQDYNTAKGRCCRMEVIGIHGKNQKEGAWEDRGFVDTRKEYPEHHETKAAKETTNSSVKFFFTRRQARDYVNSLGLNTTAKVVDIGTDNIYHGGQRWKVVDVVEEIKPNPLSTFLSRDAARVHIRSAGGTLVDLHSTNLYDSHIHPDDINRWGVYHG